MGYTLTLTGTITQLPPQLNTLQTWCQLAITHDPTYNNINIINIGDEDTGTVTITFNPALPFEYPPYVNVVECSPGNYKRYVDGNNYYYKLTIDNIAPDCQIKINAGLPLHGTITTQNNCIGDANF
jgi:hypothetical protein